MLFCGTAGNMYAFQYFYSVCIAATGLELTSQPFRKAHGGSWPAAWLYDSSGSQSHAPSWQSKHHGCFLVPAIGMHCCKGVWNRLPSHLGTWMTGHELLPAFLIGKEDSCKLSCHTTGNIDVFQYQESVLSSTSYKVSVLVLNTGKPISVLYTLQLGMCWYQYCANTANLKNNSYSPNCCDTSSNTKTASRTEIFRTTQGTFLGTYFYVVMSLLIVFTGKYWYHLSHSILAPKDCLLAICCAI